MLKFKKNSGAKGLTNASYTNTRCSAGQVSIATEVTNTEENNADHLFTPPPPSAYLLSTTHSKDVRFQWMTLYKHIVVTILLGNSHFCHLEFCCVPWNRTTLTTSLRLQTRFAQYDVNYLCTVLSVCRVLGIILMFARVSVTSLHCPPSCDLKTTRTSHTNSILDETRIE